MASPQKIKFGMKTTLLDIDRSSDIDMEESSDSEPGEFGSEWEHDSFLMDGSDASDDAEEEEEEESSDGEELPPIQNSRSASTSSKSVRCTTLPKRGQGRPGPGRKRKMHDQQERVEDEDMPPDDPREAPTATSSQRVTRTMSPKRVQQRNEPDHQQLKREEQERQIDEKDNTISSLVFIKQVHVKYEDGPVICLHRVKPEDYDNKDSVLPEAHRDLFKTDWQNKGLDLLQPKTEEQERQIGEEEDKTLVRSGSSSTAIAEQASEKSGSKASLDPSREENEAVPSEHLQQTSTSSSSKRARRTLPSKRGRPRCVPHSKQQSGKNGPFDDTSASSKRNTTPSRRGRQRRVPHSKQQNLDEQERENEDDPFDHMFDDTVADEDFVPYQKQKRASTSFPSMRRKTPAKRGRPRRGPHCKQQKSNEQESENEANVFGDESDDDSDISVDNEDFVLHQQHTSAFTSTPSEARPTPSKRGRQRSAPDSQNAGERRWHTTDEPDEAPPLPKFDPKNVPGPRIDMTASWTPLSLFKLFFSASAIKTIINNTNENAARRKALGLRYKWTPLTVPEFYIFMIIVIFSGLVQVHARADLWRTQWPYKFVFPRNWMSRDRFEAIFWSLHLSDIKEDEENQKKRGTPQYDRLFKIKPLYNQIVNACTSLYQPYKEISIDERMVASKARISFRQYMKCKPTRHGYKLFVLADSKTGYTWNFFVYQGKSSTCHREGLGYTTVMDLMNFNLLGKGYHLYVDNFYTSPALFTTLANNHTVACGTIRQGLADFPKTSVNDISKRADRGEIRWMRKDNLLFVKWKDTKEVAMCSNIHQAYSGGLISRRVKEGGQWVFKDIPIPDAVKDYNKYMGGVDLSDALIQFYCVLGKTMRWYKTFFYHFVDIAIVNSYILFKQMAIRKGQTPVAHKRFREILMRQLVEESRCVADLDGAPCRTLTNTCLPMYFGEDATAQRKTCVLCKLQQKKSKTPVFCGRCDVALCLTSKRNCFATYHLKK